MIKEFINYDNISIKIVLFIIDLVPIMKKKISTF